MIRVKNEKIELSIYKNGKFEKSYTFKNSLTNLFLKSIMYHQIPTSMASDLYPTLDAIDFNHFGFVYFDFTEPKQNITVDTETVNISGFENSQIILYNTNPKIIYSEKGKKITTEYSSKTLSSIDKLQYLFFASGGTTTVKLTSFVDVSGLNIYPDENTVFKVTRYDEIESNEKGILELNSNNNDYLPRIENSTFENLIYSPKIYGITFCYQENGIEDAFNYSWRASRWSYELIDDYTIEFTGFYDFYIGTCDYPQEDYPQEDYPQDCRQIKSIRFLYEYTKPGNDTIYIESYVNIEDLDVTYNNTEFKIRLKCERGVY